jgi:hypothetical protein
MARATVVPEDDAALAEARADVERTERGIRGHEQRAGHEAIRRAGAIDALPHVGTLQ